jgi:predicted RNase H-like nuclease
MSLRGPTLVGVDGCRAGWIAVISTHELTPEVRTFPRFEDIIELLPDDAVVAVDMPIGLPNRTIAGGRGPERAVRPYLGMRQSSVFSIPSRSAVFAENYRECCELARATSEPPRKVSKQAFHLFPRIREIDAVIGESNQHRIREVHPELAFWRLNDECAMRLPKKIRGRINPAGMEERRAVLVRSGLPEAFVRMKPPRGAATDDLLDACACMAVAARIVSGHAAPFPNPPLRDARGLDMAIWA